MSDDDAITRSGGNVFADAGLPDADSQLVKAQLVSRIDAIIRERGLTQRKAARILDVAQPDLSNLLRGRFRGYSVERLMRMLTALDCEVSIVVAKKGCEAATRDSIVGVITQTAPTATQAATGKVQNRMALQHFLGATRFCREVVRIEQDHSNQPYGFFFDEIRWHFAACVIMSIASIEAYLNEAMDSTDFDSDLARLIDRQKLLDRYMYFLKFTGKPDLPKGTQPTQSIDALIELRDAMVHFKPEWYDQQEKHKRLEQKLPRLRMSPFIAREDVFFPQRCITSSYAEWAVRSTFLFLKEFSELSELTFRIAKHKPDFVK